MTIMRNVWTIYGLQISMEPHDVITLYGICSFTRKLEQTENYSRRPLVVGASVILN